MTTATAQRRRWLLIGGVMLGLSMITWGAGFAWFLRLTARPAAQGNADGIVVLTGGADRIVTGLHLLQAHRAARLLISGIGGRADLAALARGSGVDAAALAERIALGRAAMSTHGNALETAAWARENRIDSLIVVTGWYHMPRALTELHAVMPRVRLLPVPVHPVGPNGEPLFTVRLLLEEYTKYLLTRSGLSRWFPTREGALMTGHAAA